MIEDEPNEESYQFIQQQNNSSKNQVQVLPLDSSDSSQPLNAYFNKNFTLEEP